MRVTLSPTANTETELTANEDKLAPTVIKTLVERGSMFVGSGDLRSARRLYERAAEAGDPQKHDEQAQLLITRDPRSKSSNHMALKMSNLRAKIL